MRRLCTDSSRAYLGRAAPQAVQLDDGMTIEDFPAHARAHWPAVPGQISEGRYQQQAVRRVDIPKQGGGKRMLGIPTVMDRVIQQAIAQVLTPILPDVLGIEFRLLARPQCTPGDQAGAGDCEGRQKHRSGHRSGQVL